MQELQQHARTTSIALHCDRELGFAGRRSRGTRHNVVRRERHRSAVPSPVRKSRAKDPQLQRSTSSYSPTPASDPGPAFKDNTGVDKLLTGISRSVAGRQSISQLIPCNAQKTVAAAMTDLRNNEDGVGVWLRKSRARSRRHRFRFQNAADDRGSNRHDQCHDHRAAGIVRDKPGCIDRKFDPKADGHSDADGCSCLSCRARRKAWSSRASAEPAGTRLPSVCSMWPK